MSTTTEKLTIFGERLKTELERQEMSLRQFAEKAGLTLTTACRYVHIQRTPRATEILKAAKALGVTCDYMLGLSDDPHKTRDGWSKAGFHELPSAQPEKRTDKRTETHACDLISRQAAIDAVDHICPVDTDYDCTLLDRVDVRYVLSDLPSAQPEHTNSCYTNSWCIDCKEYDTENKCCPRYNRVIKQTLDEVYAHAETEAEARYHAERKKGKWIYGEDYIGRDGWICDKCGHFIAWDYSVDLKSAEKDLPNFCPNCGADMREPEDIPMEYFESGGR